MKLQRHYGAADFRVIGVSEMDPGQSRAFVKQFEVNFPLYSRGKQVFDGFEVKAVPALFLVDRDGSIIARDLIQCRRIIQARHPKDEGEEVDEGEKRDAPAGEAAPAAPRAAAGV